MIRKLKITEYPRALCCGAVVVYVFAFGAGSAFPQAPDTLRVATYNILNFPGAMGPERIPEFRRIVQAIECDILAVQEMQSQAGVNAFLDDVLRIAGPGDWEATPFHDGPDTDNALFYRTEAVEFVSTRQISTQLRDISEYVLRLPNDTTAILQLYSAHLKASQGEQNEQRRLAEATILRDYLNELPEGSNFLALGDFNLYRSSEPAYEMLIGEPDNAGHSFDPIDTPGDWHEDSTFAPIHTQSTRYGNVGDGGASGGLDDRFDFILGSAAMFDTIGFQYLEGSYTSFGNDGDHFNRSINDGHNSAVPDSIADALYYASDHLPLFLDLLFHPAGSASRLPSVVIPDFQLYPNFPNPFNAQTLIRYEVASPGHVHLQVFDILGRRVATLLEGFQLPGTYSVAFEADGLSSGTYFYFLKTHQAVQMRSMMLIR